MKISLSGTRRKVINPYWLKELNVWRLTEIGNLYMKLVSFIDIMKPETMRKHRDFTPAVATHCCKIIQEWISKVSQHLLYYKTTK